MTRCELCGELVNPIDPNTHQRVTGWERRAAAGSRKSGSDIVCREQQQAFAHAHCVRRQKMGLSAQQGSMVL